MHAFYDQIEVVFIHDIFICICSYEQRAAFHNFDINWLEFISAIIFVMKL